MSWSLWDLLKISKAKLKNNNDNNNNKWDQILETPLHGQFEIEMESLKDNEVSEKWLKYGYMKRGTESVTMTGQGQALYTKDRPSNVYRPTDDTMFVEKQESDRYVICGSKTLAQREYKKRHVRVLP